MRLHTVGLNVCPLRSMGCLLLAVAAMTTGVSGTQLWAQPATSADSLAVARNDSVRAGDEHLMQPLQRIMDLDSALAMTALPRLHLDATRDLARATVLNHRATGDSLRTGTATRQRGFGATNPRYKSSLEDKARRMLPNKDVDIAYVTHAIALQQAALRMIDEQLTAELQSESTRTHVATARLNALERLKYSEALRRELSGQRKTGR